MNNLVQSINHEIESNRAFLLAVLERIESAEKRMGLLEDAILQARKEFSAPLKPMLRGIDGMLNSGPKESVDEIKTEVADVVAEHEKRTGQKLVANGGLK